MASLGAALREHPHWGELSDTAGATAHLQVSLGLQNKGCCHFYSYIHSDVSAEVGRWESLLLSSECSKSENCSKGFLGLYLVGFESLNSGHF